MTGSADLALMGMFAATAAVVLALVPAYRLGARINVAACALTLACSLLLAIRRPARASS